MVDLDPVQEPQPEAMGGCMLRLFWLVVGPLGLVAMIAVASKAPDALLALSVGFWLLVALMVAARYLDIVKYQGDTVDGQPASRKHWNRYVLKLVAVAAALWSGVALLS